MEKKQLEELLKKYERRECTAQERAYVEKWYLTWGAKSFDLSEEELIGDLAEVRAKLPKQLRISKLFVRIAAAAVIVLAVGVSIYEYRTSQQKQVTANQVAINSIKKIVPGREQAMLTLSDGSTVLLDTAKSLSTIHQAGANISKTAEGKLLYEDNDNSSINNVYNTISTPSGGRYQITLPDGTLVILNAATKMKFPVKFFGNERRVELDGEAYFEVAKDVNRPFYVVSSKQTIQVLGTHFNVNSYSDEPTIRTTLLEGSVLVKGVKQALLKPGQQSNLSNKNENLSVTNVDVETAVAWKNNLFFFENEPIKNCMRQISRWYNVEIVYQDDMTDKKIWGSVNRFSEFNKVLEILELTGDIHFKIDGRRVIVMK